MARPTKFKLKRKGRWVDLEDVQAQRNAPPEKVEFPTLDLASLPDRAVLDPEMPLDQLFYEQKAIRAYVTLHTDYETGVQELRIRSGIPPEYRAVAQDILRKYGCTSEKANKKPEWVNPQYAELVGIKPGDDDDEL